MGVVAVGIGLSIGVALGMVAATREGRLLDEAIMRLCDFTFAFPAVLTAILILTFLGPGLVNAIIAIGIFNIPVFARIARGAALQVMARDYIRAARAAGLTTFGILHRHVLPNITGILIVQASVQFALAILAEAGLSYLASARSRQILLGQDAERQPDLPLAGAVSGDFPRCGHRTRRARLQPSG